ncbi:hypothetical protein M3649_02340 [Ureibacillus chungkukjangi]|uniref:hypothetical protein n=1 Tax=Ureibacillus chungkukjangi TaxID=1202712 RepID=UPI00203F58C9|nr:hypothetical protein [Ureibacillus chungkukjangi]MCM3386968.1 hypothetical protein [Ureibacillus chungkukjangi]
MKKVKILNENGISLLEAVTSILLLSIILICIFNMIIESSKTTARSEDIIDATYIAQSEMEELYKFAKDNKLDLPNLYYNSTNRNYTNKGLINGKYVFESEKEDIYIKLLFKVDNTYNNLTRVIVQVYEEVSNKQVLKAQMENTLEWGT